MADALVRTSPADIAEPGIIGNDPNVDADLPRLIGYYEDSEQTFATAREKAERDRDYVDNKQLTQDEVDKLRKRGQPPIALNLIRSRAAFLAGMEKKQRRDPKAYPRNNPEDMKAAEAFTEGMRYVVERADYASVRSQAWKNITIEGFGGLEIAAVQNRRGDYEFTINRIPWDRLFFDPHSAEPDFSDSRYFGQVLWLDYDEALARVMLSGQVDEARAKDILESTLGSAPTIGRTYDDKPRWQVWADGKRKRVRIVMLWHKEVDGWRYCEFTKAGKFSWSEEPYVDQEGESYCPWLLESANVDRENNRYGEMRHLIDPQDEVNNRRSKGLHLANSKGVIATEGAVSDINKTRRELAKTDFYIELQPGFAEKFEIVNGAELATSQVALYQEAIAYFREAGPNQALLGKGPQDQSGRALEAQQAGGLVEQSDLMDTLRRLDKRAFTVIASMMKQFWTAEKWIRTTDDPDSPEYIGLNVPKGAPIMDPETGEPAIHPETGEPMEGQPEFDENGQSIHGHHNDVAQLDTDIIVSDAPSAITLDGENFQAMMELMKAGLPPPMMKLAIEMHPSLSGKRKKQLTDLLDELTKPTEKPPEQADAERLMREKLEAEIVKLRSEGYKNLTTGESTMAALGAPVSMPPQPDVAEGFGDAPQPPPMAPPGPPMGPQGGRPPMAPPMAGPPQGAPAEATPGPGPAPGPGMVGLMSGRPPVMA